MLVDSVCEENLPEHLFGSVEHAPGEPEYEYRPQCRVQSHAQTNGAVAESGDAHPPAFGHTHPPGACADSEFGREPGADHASGGVDGSCDSEGGVVVPEAAGEVFEHGQGGDGYGGDGEEPEGEHAAHDRVVCGVGGAFAQESAGVVFLHGGGAFGVGEVVVADSGNGQGSQQVEGSCESDGEGWGGEGCDCGCDGGAEGLGEEDKAAAACHVFLVVVTE